MKRPSRPQIVGGLVTAVVIAVILTGLFVLGSPAEERALRLDDRRVRDLAAIAQAIDVYWTRQARLPTSLDELREEPGAEVHTADPTTNAAYEYRPERAATYELCATFARETRADSWRGSDGFWSHGSGRQCFRRTARAVR